MVLFPEISQTGFGFTVSVLAQVDVQPFNVTVTVYVPAVEILPVLAVAAVKPPGPIHAYVPPPLAVKLVVWPAHIVLVPVIPHTGNCVTVSVLAHVDVQPFKVTVTV